MKPTRYTIRVKLIVLLGMSAAVAILISSLAMGYLTLITEKRELITSLKRLSTISSENIRAALAFEDKESATKILNPLKTSEDIIGAIVFKRDNSLFTSFFSDGIETSQRDAFAAEMQDLTSRHSEKIYTHLEDVSSVDLNKTYIITPISLNNSALGSLCIISQSNKLYKKLRYHTIIQIVVAALTLLFIVIISIRLQRPFTSPIYNLLNIMERVSNEKDYSVSANIQQTDEFEELFSGFNAMIKEIRDRDIKLEKYNQDLGGLVTARTEELAKTIYKLKAANRVKSEFLATMSHELRTPMNGVLGMAELLSATTLSGKQSHYIETIRNSGSSLLQLINNILDFTKLESDKMSLAIAPTSLNNLLSDTYNLIQPIAEKKQITFIPHFVTNAHDYILADELKLKQVLTNLLGNAIKFTDCGSVEVIVQTKILNDDRITIYLEVRDDGIGIAPDKQEMIFDLFSQVDGSNTRKYGGTGLGLNISAKIIDLMGAKLQVDSTLNKGSRFFFSFETELATKQSVPTEQLITSFTSKFSGKVLIADDEPVNLEVGSDMLESLGLNVTTATNGQEAVTAATHTNYDLIFMDIQMPVMDGLEATKQIRLLNGGALENPPIIALTANAIFGDRERFLAAGLDDYLSKPFAENSLSEKISHWLQPTCDTATEKEISARSYPFKALNTDAFNQFRSRYPGERQKKLIHILEIFLKSAEQHRLNLKGLLQIKNYQGIAALTHALKSSSANIGAVELSDQSRLIEQGINNQTLIPSTKEVNHLRDLIELTCNDINQFIVQQNHEILSPKPAETTQEKTILILDDDEVILEIMADSVEQMGYHVVAFTNARTAIEHISSSIVDLIMVDVEMPIMDGYKTIKEIKQIERYRNTPIIMVTGSDDYSAIEKSFDVGATDFETKPINWPVFAHRLQYIFKASDAFQQINQFATQDTLTGLPNRRYTMEKMDTMFLRSTRKNEHIGIIIIDIDHFKRVNDSYGHPVGDIVLKEVAAVLAACSRGYDIVGRIGGEEFLVLCENSPIDETLNVAQRMRKAVENLNVTYDGNQTLNVTISLGAISAIPEDKLKEHFFKAADDALYCAKRNGRNQVHKGELT